MGRRTTETRVCIYCRQQKNLSDFDKEHVVPQAFGHFQDNLTLRCVCRECNALFGRTLDLVLGRDSYEARLRCVHGLKPLEKAHQLRLRCVDVVLEDDSVPLAVRGLRLRYAPGPNGLEVQPVPQVGILWEGESNWKYYSESDIGSSQELDPRTRKKIVAIKILAPEARRESIRRCLNERGIKFKLEREEPIGGPNPGDFIRVTATVSIDSMVRRGIAKIAFNYLAWAHGACFVLRRDFEEVREFIRHGKSPATPIVTATDEPILYYDEPNRRQTSGHIIAIDWNGPTSLIARVSLFNEITYQVVFSRDYQGLWFPFSRGHHFNIESGRVTEMLGLATPKRR